MNIVKNVKKIAYNKSTVQRSFILSRECSINNIVIGHLVICKISIWLHQLVHQLPIRNNYLNCNTHGKQFISKLDYLRKTFDLTGYEI